MSTKKLNKNEKAQILHIIQTAADYLSHPDVQALPFALPSSNIARALREVVARVKQL